MNIRQEAAGWLASANDAIVVTIINARGSVPRESGTRMVVSRTGVVGTVGGGHLEWQAIARARELVGCIDEEAGPMIQHFALGPSLGQCCGGALDLAFEPLTAKVLATWPVAEIWFHLQLYGAGHVGRAMVTALAGFPCRIDWIDEREAEFPQPLSALAPHAVAAEINKLCVDAVEAEVAHAPVGAYYLIMTHQHDLDLRITEAVLRRNDARYVGLIGSLTKRARFESRLREKGFTTQQIASLTCPIGVLPSATPHGKEPAVIAAGVVSQLLGYQASCFTP